jgi:hypothetical protein
MRFKWWYGALLLVFALAIVSPLASAWPDGLERVAEDKGFIDKSQEAPYEIVPDYIIPGVPNDALATILAGILGVILMFGLGYGLAKLLAIKR